MTPMITEVSAVGRSCGVSRPASQVAALASALVRPRPTHGSTPARALIAAGAVTSVLLLAACGGGSADAASASSTAPLSTATPAASTASPSASATARATSASPSSSSAAKGGTVTAVAPLTAGPAKHLQGSKGGFTWDITVPAFTGSGAAVAEVNRRIQASAQSAISATATQNGDDPESKHELAGEASLTTNDGRTVQVDIPMSDYYEGAAHPTNVDNTVVLVAATGAPVTLDQVFTDQEEALRSFAPLVRQQAKADGYEITSDEGLEPTTANWSAWQTDADGMTFTFQDYQLGMHGMPSYTIPWKTVTPLLTPYAKALLAPTS